MVIKGTRKCWVLPFDGLIGGVSGCAVHFGRRVPLAERSADSPDARRGSTEEVAARVLHVGCILCGLVPNDLACRAAAEEVQASVRWIPVGHACHMLGDDCHRRQLAQGASGIKPVRSKASWSWCARFMASPASPPRGQG